MKKVFVYLLLIFGLVPLASPAQVSVNINIGSQPLWGPTGYDYVEYYYLPDIESYYHVPSRKFIYLNNGRWIFSAAKPPMFSNYDLYNGYKVVINSPKPYLQFKEQKVKYAKYKSNHSQMVILRSNDAKYHVVKGHPKHVGNNGKKGGASNHGKQKGHAKGKNKG